MNIKLVIIIVLSIVYGLFELIMGLYQKRQKETVKSGDKKSLWILTIGITLGYWLSVLLMIIPVFVGYAYRIKVEEHFMMEQFGQNYLDFQKRTKKLIPMIY